MKKLALLVPLIALAAAPAFSAPAKIDFSAPQILVRLESFDTLVRAVEFRYEDAGADAARRDLEGFLQMSGLGGLRRDEPIRAGLWNLSISDLGKTDFAIWLPVAETNIPIRFHRALKLSGVREYAGVSSFPFFMRPTRDPSLWVAFRDDRIAVMSRPELAAALPLVDAVEPALPGAGASVFVPSVDAFEGAKERSGGTTDEEPPDWTFSPELGKPVDGSTTNRPHGFFSFGPGLYTARTEADISIRAALAFSREDGLAFAMASRLRPETPEAVAPQPHGPVPLSDADFAAVPAGALAWRLRSSDAISWTRPCLNAMLLLPGTPENGKLMPAYQTLGDAFKRLGRSGGGAVRAVFAPNADGRFRFESRNENVDGDAVLSFARALADLRDRYMELVGAEATNDWFVRGLASDAVSFAPDGVSGTLRCDAADPLAALFGPEIPFRVGLSGGGVTASAGAAGPFAAEPQPIALDGVRRWFPDLRPASLWGLRADALEDVRHPRPGSGDAILVAIGKCGEEWVTAISASPDQMKTLFRMLWGSNPATQSPAGEKHAASAEVAE